MCIRDRVFTIGSGNTDKGRDSACHELGEGKLRSACQGTAFSAAASHVNVLVDKTRRNDCAVQIYHFQTGKVGRDFILHSNDFFIDCQNLFDALMFRSVQICIFKEKMCIRDRTYTTLS